MFKPFAAGLLACATFASFTAHAADDVIRLGNLKLAHFAAVSYIKEIAPKCGIQVTESTFAKGLDVMQASLPVSWMWVLPRLRRLSPAVQRASRFMWWPALQKAVPAS